MSIVLLILFLLAALALVTFYEGDSPKGKGDRGEAFVKFYSTQSLSATDYIQFHNIILPNAYGTTQIDHLIISRFGIFVIETKNMAGWIFGGTHQKRWTQVLYRDSFKFQNPLHQNNVHMNAVQLALTVHPGLIHSIVVFVGDGTFKTPMPANVMRDNHFVSYIKSYTADVFSESEVQRAVSRIHQIRLESTPETEQRHVMRLRMRPRPSSEQKCPICGNDMVPRIAKNGFRAGRKFWGCSKYPTCRGIRNVS
jgi:hypothetical protein